ncbi:Spc7 kinetochore protein-domain-containing protein [Kockiozyma suomiensis]|uniref:Spc7 kinetochore protein-domain-containing protein n=1 Tax=Kockiozyma suomiensis TaxID=1337062 RepID=UPI00334306EB
MPSPSKVSPRKSPRNHRQSLAFLPSNDKENTSNTLRLNRKKRAKSLDGSEDVTISVPKRSRNESRTPTARGPPRGILKASYANDDNHTVIGVMQVALKEEPAPKPKADAKAMSRRVSFAPEATLHTFDIDNLDDSSSVGNSSAASTPRRSDKSNATNDRPPLADLEKFNQHSPVASVAFRAAESDGSFQRVSPGVWTPPRKSKEADDNSDELDDDSEVEMEDATDVFDDVFDGQQAAAEPASSQNTFTPDEGRSNRFNASFFSPLGVKVRPISPRIVNLIENDEDEEDDDGNTQAMDITGVFGSISSGNRDTSPESDAEDEDDQTMDVTRAVGRIEARERSTNDDDDDDDDDDDGVTMDLTTAIGLIQPKAQVDEDDDNITMEVTQAVGSIRDFNEDEERTENMSMEVTRAVGFIQAQEDAGTTTGVASAIGEVNEQEVDENDDADNLTMEVTQAIGFIQPDESTEEQEGKASENIEVNNSISQAENEDTVAMDVTVAIGAISQGLPDFETRSDNVFMESPEPRIIQGKSPSTPPLATTPVRSTSAPRSGSLVRSESITRNTPLLSIQNKLLNSVTGSVSKASPKGSPVGSPRSAEILQRRKSILENEVSMPEFNGQTISIGTPDGQKLKSDINETLFNFNTSSLQKRIQSLTPKKVIRTPVKSLMKSARKEVIAAMKSEEQEMLTKRYSPLKTRTGSPTKPSVRHLSDIPAPVLRLDSVVRVASTPTATSFSVADHPDEEDGYIPLSLNEFLRMTSVQFLEGLNTKRRNTTFMQSRELITEQSFADTVLSRHLHCPMLELYEFSCRELRKNIQEGNELFDRLEAETLEENPSLFRQYLSASIDGQVSFCAQFKVIKNFARLQSKGVWYEWRSKLLDGVLNSLTKNLAALQKDDQELRAADSTVSPSLPEIRDKHSKLKAKLEQLRRRKNEVEDCDKDELLNAREKLKFAKLELEEKQAARSRVIAGDAQLNSLIDAKQSEVDTCKSGIARAETIISENRGIDTEQTEQLKDKLSLIGEMFGCRIVSYANGGVKLSLDDLATVDISIENEKVTNVSINGSDSPVISFFVAVISNLADSQSAGLFLRNSSHLLSQHKYVCNEIEWLKSRYVSNIKFENNSLLIDSEVFIREPATKMRVKYWLTFEESNSACPVIRCTSDLEPVYGSVDSLPRFACRPIESVLKSSTGRERMLEVAGNSLGAFMCFY